MMSLLLNALFILVFCHFLLTIYRIHKMKQDREAEALGEGPDLETMNEVSERVIDILSGTEGSVEVTGKTYNEADEDV